MLVAASGGGAAAVAGEGGDGRQELWTAAAHASSEKRFCTALEQGGRPPAINMVYVT